MYVARGTNIIASIYIHAFVASCTLGTLAKRNIHNKKHPQQEEES